jgi:hypothetical protein
MRKLRTHFEQIPVQKVKDAIVANSAMQQNESGTRRGRWPILRCRICRKSVPVETAKTDGEGQAVHEECYLLLLKPEPTTSRTRPAGL